MSSGNIGISRHAFLDTIEAGISLGIGEREELMQAAGLPGSGDAVPERVTSKQLQNLWRYFGERSRAGHSNPEYGLRIGQRIDPNTKGLLASWVSQCPNLGEALRVFTRNSQLMSTIDSFGFSRHPKGVQIDINSHSTSELPQAYTERTMAALVAWAKHLTGQPLKPKYATFRWPRPNHVAAYYSIFGQSLYFESNHNSLIFDEEALTEPVVSANAYLKELLGDQVKDRLRQLEATTGLAPRVTELVRQNLTDPSLSIEKICQELGTSRQTLYRHLKAEGTGFSEIHDAVRKEQASSLIQNAGINYAELGYGLGFKDPSSAHKALKRWFGKPLSELR